MKLCNYLTWNKLLITSIAIFFRTLSLGSYLKFKLSSWALIAVINISKQKFAKIYIIWLDCHVQGPEVTTPNHVRFQFYQASLKFGRWRSNICYLWNTRMHNDMWDKWCKVWVFISFESWHIWWTSLVIWVPHTSITQNKPSAR